MNKENNKNNTYYVLNVICIVALVVFTYMFLKFYNTEAVEFITEGARKDVQVLEIYSFRGSQLNMYFLVDFIVIAVSMFVLYLSYLRGFKSDKVLKILSIILAIAIIGSVLISFSTILWLIMLGLFFLAVIINFIIYVFSNKNEKHFEDEVLYEEDGFKTKEAADRALRDYLKAQEETFSKKKISIDSEINKTDDGYEFVVFVADNKTGKE